MSARSISTGLMKRRRVVVVGGGVVGCASAFECVGAGLDVTLVERDGIAAHASGRNAGNLNPLIGATAAQLPVAIAAFRRHAEICGTLAGLGCGGFALAPIERLIVGFEEGERAGLQATAALFQSTEGFSARWLEPDEARRTEPRLSRDVAFGIHTTGSFSLDAAAFTRALALAATKLGARIVRSAVTGLTSEGDRIVSVDTVAGALACDEVVIATGAWAAEADGWLGDETAVRPVKGEMLLIRLPGGLLAFDITGAGVALYNRRGNQTWLGVTATEEGFDVRPTTQARETLLSKARRMMPEIAQAEVLDHVAALRPVAIPDAPIVRRAAGWANATIANGGGSKGVLLAVGMARRVRELLTGSAVPISSIA